MQAKEELAKKLYSKDTYIVKNPSLHEDESPFKISNIIPLVDKFIEYCNEKDEIKVLDVGGGAGLILQVLSDYIEKEYWLKVNKYALDMSPGILEIQKERNPDIVQALNEDVRHTSLGNKEIDLALLIDVLEHVPDPTKALQEIKRISNFCILRVPLEDRIGLTIWNFINRGKPRKTSIETWGHINIFNFARIRNDIEKHAGRVKDFHCTLKFDSHLNIEKHTLKRLRCYLKNFLATATFSMSPKLSSMTFGNSAFILVQCY